MHTSRPDLPSDPSQNFPEYQKPQLSHIAPWQVVTGSVLLCLPPDFMEGCE